MQPSFYDASIMCYEQILQSTANVLKAGREHAEASDMPLSDMETYMMGMFTSGRASFGILT